jgi:hypothetical protein
MEKLIELLNEYENYLDTTDRNDIQVHFRHINWADVRCFHNYSLIISKRYWFIKRLVDNDKIKYNKVPEHIYVSDYSFETIHKWMTDNILMWLAIQDEPIEFLCSILK